MTKQRNNRLWAFLEASGVLANGTLEQIAAKRREYRRLYEREYKRRYREAHLEVRFTLDSRTNRLLLVAANQAGQYRGTYAKHATLARLDGKAYSDSQKVSREMLQKVTLIHSEVRHLCRHKPMGFLDRRVTYDRLAERIAALEDALKESLRNDI